MYSQVLLPLTILVHFALSDKYSKESNERESVKPELNFFRLNKYNDVWRKAKETVPEDKLPDLKRVLKKLDKTELEIKHLKANAKEYDGELEAAVRERFLEVLDEYGLVTNQVYQHEMHKTHEFDDPRLDKLWKKAVHEADYTAEELAKLRYEFQHIQDSITEYKEMADILGKHEGESNHISDLPPEDLPKKSASEIKQLRRDVKDKYHDVKETLHDIEKKISYRAVEDYEKFTDSRVVELWDAARQGGKFSESELNHIKEELKHFQVRIAKHDHWMSQAENLADQVKSGSEHLREEYQTIKEKAQEHARVVKKYHGTMLDKIGQHTEL